MSKVSASGVIRYGKMMRAAGSVYLWGADVEIITEDLIESLKSRFGTENYKNISLEDVEGKIGADCSGFLHPLSGKDNTAEGYYSECIEKGNVEKMPEKVVCLIFRQESGKIVHVAIYTGDGMLFEMWNGCEYRKFVASEWSFYGIPDWIEQMDKPLAAGDTVQIAKELTGHNTAADAVAGKDVRNRVVPGKYIVYKVYGKAVNVTKTKGSPGSWVVIQ